MARISHWQVPVLLLAVLLLMLVWRPWRLLPPAWQPWAPLAVTHAMTPVTRWKLMRLRDAPAQACLEVLATAPPESADYLPLADYTPAPDCPLANVVRVRATSVAFNAPFTAHCPLAVAWLMYEQQALQPLARDTFGEPVAAVNHFGSFSCRNIYHRANARRSEHATATALDVAGFRLADGTRIVVLDDWDNTARPQHGVFLRAAHTAACDYFGTVLGPDYNAPHANHFHFGTRGLRYCR